MSAFDAMAGLSEWGLQDMGRYHQHRAAQASAQAAEKKRTTAPHGLIPKAAHYAGRAVHFARSLKKHFQQGRGESFDTLAGLTEKDSASGSSSFDRIVGLDEGSRGQGRALRKAKGLGKAWQKQPDGSEAKAALMSKLKTTIGARQARKDHPRFSGKDAPYRGYK